MAAVGEALERLAQIMARLRAADGCPWDRQQDIRSLRPYLIEEAYEVLEEMDRVASGGPWQPLCEELGDLLFQVVFHAQLASEIGEFTLADVCRVISEKIVRRHPHVFGERQVDGAEQVLANWARLKAEEKRQRTGSEGSVLDGVPAAAPALLRAERLTEKASRIGFDWPDLAGVRGKLAEELGELDEAIFRGDRDELELELGDALFSLVNLARFLGTPPEDALRQANRRFTSRFHHIEAGLRQEGIPFGEASLAKMEDYWQKAKALEAAVPPPRRLPRASVVELRLAVPHLDEVGRFWDVLAATIGWTREQAPPGELRYAGGTLAVTFARAEAGTSLPPGAARLRLDAPSRTCVDALHHSLARLDTPGLLRLLDPYGLEFLDPAGLCWCYTFSEQTESARYVPPPSVD